MARQRAHLMDEVRNRVGRASWMTNASLRSGEPILTCASLSAIPLTCTAPRPECGAIKLPMPNITHPI
ncbi:hypothetical protein CBF17_009245 [Pantoea agglomerans]|nr:hypothetical protein CBF17_009245 [Pantoea agglomerans]